MRTPFPEITFSYAGFEAHSGSPASLECSGPVFGWYSGGQEEKDTL